MKPIRKSISVIIASLITLGSLAEGARADISVVPVNATQVNVANELGTDFFSLSTANGGTAFYFGNQDSNNLDTANRVPLVGPDEQQYFQADTIIPSTLGTPQGSTLAYYYDSAPYGGGTSGINFSVYDANQDGTADTVFRLDLGPSIADSSDDIIVAYAFDSSPSGIDVALARDALLVPEPSSLLLLALGALGLGARRRGRA